MKWEWDLHEVMDSGSNEELFNYIIKMTQSNCGKPFDEEAYSYEPNSGWWWNDKDYHTPINLDCTSDAITFITDYIEANEGTKIEIKFELGSIVVELQTMNNYYIISEDFHADAHVKIFAMVLWVIAKSLGYGEEV